MPEGIGSVRMSWRDDNGDTFDHVLTDVLYFPKSPVRILSTSKLSTEWGPTIDEEGTWILSKRSYSIFTWKNGGHTRRITHPAHCLPEMPVNEGFGSFQRFCNYCSASLKCLSRDSHLVYCTSAFSSTTVSLPTPAPPTRIATQV